MGRALGAAEVTFLAVLGPASFELVGEVWSHDPRLDMDCMSSLRVGEAARDAVLVLDVVCSILLLEAMSSEVLVTAVAAGLAAVVAWSNDGSFGLAPSPLDLEVLEVVRLRCDLAAAAASFAWADASRSAADCVCFRGEAPVEAIDEAGEVERMASDVVSTEVVVVSTIDVGRARVVGKESLGVRVEGGLDEELSPPRCSNPDMTLQSC